jgi:voltage-gated potassium channel
MTFNNSITRGALALIFIVGVGLLWYTLVEQWSLIDEAYMVVVTITTVGYDEVRPLSAEGRVFNLFFMVAGVGVVLYILTAVVRSFIEEQFISNFLRRRRMEGKLAEIADHFIICGFGRVGREVARQLEREGERFVVVDKSPERVGQGTDEGVLMLVGDATVDATLLRSGHTPRTRPTRGRRQR